MSFPAEPDYAGGQTLFEGPASSSRSFTDDQSASVPSSYTDSIRQPGCEPVAIVGIGCRLPGGADSPSKLWDLLINSTSTHGKVPAQRFNASGFFHADSKRPGSLPSTGGYFLQHDIRRFDNAFFGINNLEATYLDPQQRQLLEVVYEAYESAGHSLESINGSNIGCFVGNFTNDYTMMQFKDAEYSSHYSATGAAPSILANRISYVFNTHGPSVVMDTACSSSMYGLHMACNALYSRECEAAVVASANLVQSPEQHLQAVKAGILSSDSTCHTYDVSANGYGRAEGVGALYLKRLSDAIRDKDPIRAVIRGTAVNSNGRTTGISLPSAEKQQLVVLNAYDRAGLPLDQTQYVEAHGTGTSVGDPIEVEGLANALRPVETLEKLMIGSVKTNLGHSEGASAISSIIKVVLALEKGVIPPTIGIKKLNPRLEPFQHRIDIVREPIKWPNVSTRRAGVNSFGFGGANGHVILEAPNQDHLMQGNGGTKRLSIGPNAKYIIPLSANSMRSLENVASNLSEYVKSRSANIEDLTYTLGCRRSSLQYRSFVITDGEQLSNAFQQEKLHPGSKGVPTRKVNERKLAFIFTGQGAQWPEMGMQLSQRFPVFQNSIAMLDFHLRNLDNAPSWTFYSLLQTSNHGHNIDEASISQPLCTALQIALVDLLRDWGLQPDAVVGHSSGEIAAAYCAGAIDVEEALAIAYYRGLAVSRSRMRGAMAAIGLDKANTQIEIEAAGLNQKIRIACVNSPKSTTVSGDLDGIEVFISKLQSRFIFARMLRTEGQAYHSHHMKAIGDEYERLLSSTFPVSQARRKSRTKMISSVLSEEIDSSVLASSAYWRKNLVSPVLFDDAVSELLKEPLFSFVELGPHSVLKMPLEQIHSVAVGSDLECIYTPTLVRNKSSVESLLAFSGALFVQGYSIPFDSVNGLKRCQVLSDLPKYPWDYGEILWKESRPSKEFRTRKYPRHYLLGTKVHGGSENVFSWRNIVRTRDIPWLEDHKIEDTVVFPAIGYMSIAMEALRQYTDSDNSNTNITIRNLTISKALMIPENDTGTEIVTDFQRLPLSSSSRSKTWFTFEVSSYISDRWTTHASGVVGYASGRPVDASARFDRSSSIENNNAASWYSHLGKAGLRFGNKFQNLKAVRNFKSPSGQVLLHAQADVSLFKDSDIDFSYTEDPIHPCLLDAALQIAILSNAAGEVGDVKAFVPVSIKEIRIDLSLGKTVQALTEVSSEPCGFGVAQCNAGIYSVDDELIAGMEDIRLVEYNMSSLPISQRDRDPILRICWKPDIGHLRPSHATMLAEFLESDCKERSLGELGVAGAYVNSLLELLVHKKPSSQVLFVGSLREELLSPVLESLAPSNGMPHIESLTVASVFQGKLSGWTTTTLEGGLDNFTNSEALDLTDVSAFDLIITSNRNNWTAVRTLMIEKKITLSNDKYHLHLEDKSVCPESAFIPEIDSVLLDKNFFDKENHTRQLTFSRLKVSDTKASAPSERLPLYYVFDKEGDLFDKELQQTLSIHPKYDVKAIPYRLLPSVSIMPKATFVVSVELTRALLAEITSEELQILHSITDSADTIIWHNRNSTLQCSHPNTALAAGLSRALMVEQPTLKFSVIDIGSLDNSMISNLHTADNLFSILDQSRQSSSPDFELTQRGGMLYCSRFLPDKISNDNFLTRQLKGTIKTQLSKTSNYQLTCSGTGQMDSLFWKELAPKAARAQPGYVEVQVQAVGLNSKSLALAFGNIDSQNGDFAFQFSGVVTQTGSKNSFIKQGDHVLVMAPSKLRTHEIVPEWACLKLHKQEPLTDISTLPYLFSTALYSLETCGRIEEGESVLIHSAAEPLGQALVQVAQLWQAKILATVRSDEEKEFLMTRYGLEESCVFSCNDDDFVNGVQSSTNRIGVDIVLNSLTGDLSLASLRCCADFGRFIDVDQSDKAENGILDMSGLKRNLSYIACDLRDLYYSPNRRHQKNWERLLRQTLRYYREQKIQLIDDSQTFGADKAGDAFKALQTPRFTTTVALSFEDETAEVEVQPLQFETKLDHEKTYLMIGALGGIGRSLSKWMFNRGARRFTFLNRSGLDRDQARSVVYELQKAGAQVHVVRGSVDSAIDVQRAVDESNGPIGGVIHAAMGLHEAIFSAMTSEQWHKAISPKVKGAWNLHRSLAAHEQSLDFFIVTSSNTGSVGTATESNYCAANSFLDAFAKYRRAQGLKAVAVGLGMIADVGYIHDHPEIEKLLLRKGLHPISEKEMLQILDIAIAQESKDVSQTADWHKGHLLTGLELTGFEKQRAQGFDGYFHVLEDIRSRFLAHQFEHQTRGLDGSAQAGAAAATAGDGSWTKASLASMDRGQMHAAVKDMVVKKIANLVLVPPESLTEDTSLAQFGMDSMLAADFRTHVYRTVDADVPFIVLLEPSTSVGSIVNIVVKDLEEKEERK